MWIFWIFWWRLTVKYDSLLYLSLFGCFQKYGYPQFIHFNRVFHYFHHPFGGKHPLFLETPFVTCEQVEEQTSSTFMAQS